MRDLLPAPMYWQYETSGVLRPAVEVYLEGGAMTNDHIAAMRTYLRQWINAPAWQGRKVEFLRRSIDSLTSREAISSWLMIAEEAGIDPL